MLLAASLPLRIGHGAMVLTVASAAGRQALIVSGIEGGREWPQPEEGEPGRWKAHAASGVDGTQSNRIGDANRRIAAALRYHRFIGDEA